MYRFIPTYWHAVLDYAGGLMLIAVPLLFADEIGREASGAVWVPVFLGVLMLMQSLFTDYELSLAKVISVRAHLIMDAAVGLFLAVSPWICDFHETIWLPHVLVGLMEVAGALTTKTRRGAAPHWYGPVAR